MLNYLFSSSYSFRFLFLFSFFFTFFELCFLIPRPGPPEINPWLINQSVTYNSPLQFNCSLSGFPTPEVLWTRDGINIGKKNTLTIRQARFEDSGEYTCSAKNPTGSKKSTFWIEVKGGTVLIHIKEKELWFMIWTNVQFRYCKNSRDDAHFSNQIYEFKPHKRENWLRIKRYFNDALMIFEKRV